MTAPLGLDRTVFAGSGSPWVNAPDWDSCTVGGGYWGWKYQDSIPLLRGSKVRVIGAKRKYKIEVKDPQGSDGCIQTYRGVKFSPFDLAFYIYTDDQYSYFHDSILPILKFSGFKSAPNPAQVQALKVYHPILANLDIAAMLVEEIGGIDPQEDGPGVFVCKVKCVEYLPPPPQNTTVTPTGSKAINQPTSVGVQIDSARSKRALSVKNITTVVGNSG